jgi:hypothetical protein
VIDFTGAFCYTRAMTKIGLLGDTHGNTNWTQFALWAFQNRGIRTIAQVGDFGISNTQFGHMFL